MAVGVEALPIISLISFFVGLILSLNGAYELRNGLPEKGIAPDVLLDMLQHTPIDFDHVYDTRSVYPFVKRFSTRPCRALYLLVPSCARLWMTGNCGYGRSSCRRWTVVPLKLVPGTTSTCFSSS